MKVAAYQAPLLSCESAEAIDVVSRAVARCEAEGVEILCCPEAMIGGLADDAARPADFALDVERGQIDAALRPLASASVTTLLGFTEVTSEGHLYNSVAVLHRGSVAGVYRKHHPAIRKSIYRAGADAPVFTVAGLTFGIVICNDSNFHEPAKTIAARGATVIFVPTNNALPPEKAEVVADARSADVARAKTLGVWVIRADVAGRVENRVSLGSSVIVDPGGTIVRSARRLEEDWLVADVATPRIGIE